GRRKFWEALSYTSGGQGFEIRRGLISPPSESRWRYPTLGVLSSAHPGASRDPGRLVPVCVALGPDFRRDERDNECAIVDGTRPHRLAALPRSTSPVSRGKSCTGVCGPGSRPEMEKPV